MKKWIGEGQEQDGDISWEVIMAWSRVAVAVKTGSREIFKTYDGLVMEVK